MKSTWRGCLCSCYLRDPTGGSGSAHEPSAALSAPGPPRSAQRSPGPGAAGPGGAGSWSRGSGVPGRAGPCRAGRCRASRAVPLRTVPCPGGCPGGRRVPAGFPGCLRPGRLCEDQANAVCALQPPKAQGSSFSSVPPQW